MFIYKILTVLNIFLWQYKCINYILESQSLITAINNIIRYKSYKSSFLYLIIYPENITDIDYFFLYLFQKQPTIIYIIQ